jgi:hypothetical protein
LELFFVLRDIAMTSHKKPGVAFWATVVVVVVLVAYPLSFGPACWISSHLNAGTRAVTVVYRPITSFLDDAYVGTLDGAIRWYAGLGAADSSWGWWGRTHCDSEEVRPWTWESLSRGPP